MWRIRVYKCKTIDNDLNLPPYVDTFGFQTARHFGVDIVRTSWLTPRTTSRWYLVIAIPQGAHLALGIGKVSGHSHAHTEEFTTRPSE